MQQVKPLWRTGFFALLAPLMLMPSGSGKAADLGMQAATTELSLPPEPMVPADGRMQFAVYRKGDRIGTHTMTFSETGDGLKVDIKVKLKVEFLFVTFYKFKHQATEVWSDGRLVSFESETEQNGKEWSVTAEALPERMVVSANGEARELQGSLYPTSYWNVEALKEPVWFNTQFGSTIDVNIVSLGTEVVESSGRRVEAMKFNAKAHVVETDKPVDMDLWYAPDGELLKLQFIGEDGSLIEYDRLS